MKARIKHLYEIIAGAILSLLGFNSCEDIFYGPLEYGMPHANFKIVGDVKSEETGNPIQGISVKFRQNTDGSAYREYYTSFKTDKDGKINESFSEWPSDDIELTFEDVDGEENGGFFAPDTLRKKDLKIEFIEDKKSDWHKGDYTITFAAKLKKAAPTE